MIINTRIRHHGSVLSDVFCASDGSGVVYGFGCGDGSGDGDRDGDC